MAKKSSDDSKFIFGKTFNTMPGRTMFPVLGEPKPFENNPPKWSVGLVVKPSPRMTEIIEEINAVGIKAFGAKWTEKPDKYKRPYMTGEEVIEHLQEKGKKISEKSLALYNGNIWIAANANTENMKKQPLEPPNVYLADGSKLPRRPGNKDDIKVIDTTIYPGCYSRCAITPMSYLTGQNAGVKLILKGVMFIKDGDRLGGEDIDSLMQESVGEDFEFEDEISANFKADAESGDEANI